MGEAVRQGILDIQLIGPMPSKPSHQDIWHFQYRTFFRHFSSIFRQVIVATFLRRNPIIPINSERPCPFPTKSTNQQLCTSPKHPNSKSNAPSSREFFHLSRRHPIPRGKLLKAHEAFQLNFLAHKKSKKSLRTPRFNVFYQPTQSWKHSRTVRIISFA